MISNTYTIAIMTVLVASFLTPVVLSMWLMVKRRAKNVLLLFLIGGMAFLGGYLALVVPLKLLVFDRSFFTEFNSKLFFIGQLAISIDYAAALVIGTVVIVHLMKSGGINFNRCLSFAVGFYGVSNMYVYGISYMTKLSIVTEAINGTLKEHYADATEAELEAAVKIISDVPLYDFFVIAIKEILFVIAGMAVVLTIVYGFVNNCRVKNSLKAGAFLLIWDYSYNVVEHYINSVIGLFIVAALTALAVNEIKKINKEPKSVMIKPITMLDY